MLITGGNGETLELRAEYQTGGQGQECHERPGLRRDCGYFARFANPLNDNATVVLINGIHTAGVLGAARVFGERREALRNFLAVFASGATTARFECHFAVPVINGHVRVPTVERKNILSLGPTEKEVGTVASPRRAADVDSRHSVRVLFIAGDRGGSHLSEIQIPNEYHAIKTALRGSKHRDVIALANPILGVTRKRLTEADSDLAAIVHFAGHGNDRSLSIIEDEGLLANAAPLEADQLCKLLQAMEQRVRLCVLNACASAELAKRLVQSGAVDHAVGWPAKVSDSAAMAFSAAFYSALGDARSIAAAFDLATVACGPDYTPLFVPGAGADSPFLVIGEDQQ